jgi:tripeptide aminopeptidase
MRLVRAGETIAVFQIESPGQWHLLAQTQPQTFNDLIVQTALFRPGPIQGGFVHPYVGVADVEESSLKILLRDFDMSGLDAKEVLLKKMAAETSARFPDVKISVDVKENYKNMKEALKDYPQLTEYAVEATRRAGVTPKIKPIRGGTDGSNLTFRGLPCPDLFTGGHNFHGKLEFNSRRGLEKTTEMLVNLVQLFVEKSK